ncbi:MAG: DUF423 domain-containing protein [Cyclobacteriaceae bacterium]|nr:DUF423 domain-containing protein [Cyclobacteriaceae bacterium]MCH8516689.1 DUF423 domain-containing protein [Cyclobacteriaceae bacterium]
MSKFILAFGLIWNAIGVAIGAFGAHGLKDKLLATDRLETFETAVKYHFYHGIGIILLYILFQYFPVKLLNTSAYFMIAGTLIFSGSLYILCLSNVSKWGAVTPFGGLFLIIAWILAAWAIMK